MPCRMRLSAYHVWGWLYAYNQNHLMPPKGSSVGQPILQTPSSMGSSRFTCVMAAMSALQGDSCGARSTVWSRVATQRGCLQATGESIDIMQPLPMSLLVRERRNRAGRSRVGLAIVVVATTPAAAACRSHRAFVSTSYLTAELPWYKVCWSAASTVCAPCPGLLCCSGSLLLGGMRLNAHRAHMPTRLPADVDRAVFCGNARQ